MTEDKLLQLKSFKIFIDEMLFADEKSNLYSECY